MARFVHLVGDLYLDLDNETLWRRRSWLERLRMWLRG